MQNSARGDDYVRVFITIKKKRFATLNMKPRQNNKCRRNCFGQLNVHLLRVSIQVIAIYTISLKCGVIIVHTQ